MTGLLKYQDSPLKIWDGFFNSWISFNDMYEMKPEYKKKQLESEIKTLKQTLSYLSDQAGRVNEQLKEKEKELKKLE